MAETATLEPQAEGSATTDTGASVASPARTAEADVQKQARLDLDRAKQIEAELERDARTLDNLDAGMTPQEARQKAAAPDTAKETKAAEAEPEQTRPTAESSTEPVASKEADTPVEDYDGLDAKAIKTLKSAQMLPDKDAWAKLPIKARQKLLSTAKEEIAENTRAFQESQRTGEQPRRADGTFAPKAATPAESRTQDTVDAPRKEAPARTADAKAGDVDLTPELQELTKLYGEDAAKPLASALDKIRQQAQLASQQVKAAQEAQEQKERQQQVAVWNSQGDEARKELAKNLPIIATDNEKWDELRRETWEWFFPKVQAGKKPDWGDALKRTARLLYQEDIQLEAQRKLAANGKRSLAGTPTPPGQTQPPRKLTDDERYERAYDTLVEGRGVQEARKQFATA